MTKQATWHDESTGHLWMELPTGTRCSKCGVERTPGYIPECQIRQEKCDEEDKMDDCDTTRRKTTNINQQIHKALGKCLHDGVPPNPDYPDLVCILCGELRQGITDYTTDEKACVELLKDDRLFDARVNSMRARVEYFEPTGACKNVTADTFCLAICKAFLKSRGIEPEEQ